MRKILNIGIVAGLLGAGVGYAEVPDPSITLHESYGKLPMRFEANAGQSGDVVKFLARGKGYTVFLTPTEAVLSLVRQDKETTTQQALVTMGLVNANAKPTLTGAEKLITQSNYLLGNDPKQWRTQVANFAKVHYDEVYPAHLRGFFRKKLRRWVVALPQPPLGTIQLDKGNSRHPQTPANDKPGTRFPGSYVFLRASQGLTGV